MSKKIHLKENEGLPINNTLNIALPPTKPQNILKKDIFNIIVKRKKGGK